MPVPLLLFIAAFSLGGAAAVVLLLRGYGAPAPRSRAWFSAADLGAWSHRRLALASVLSLYLELLLIRWISSEIRIFAYFKNFVLIACFLGFGLGCYLARRAISIVALAAPLVFFSVLIALPWQLLRDFTGALPALLGATSEMPIWGVERLLTTSALGGLLLGTIATLPLFALVAVTFIPIGQLVGHDLETAPNGIAAYTVNVVASMAGIALYTALCFANQPPAVWFAIAAAIALALLWRQRFVRAVAAAAFALCIAVIVWGAHSETGTTYWSPYQKLELGPFVVGGEMVGYQLLTNNTYYQQIVDLSPAFVRAHPGLFRRAPAELDGFNLSYRFAPHPRSVLILGAGMGNDAAAALRAGAARVTAVDIDPLVLALGRRFHPEHPYASPRVTVVNDDARSFLQNTQERFDVVVFAALDSHTTSSHLSNIRIDNYVYTVEALRAGRRLLTPDGVCVLRFAPQRPWIAGRLHDMMAAVYGAQPVHLVAVSDVYVAGGNVLVAGAPERIRAALADPQLAAFVRARAPQPMEHVPLATDDWPYLYQREPGLPASVAAISVLLLAVCFAAARRVGLRVRAIRWEFFFLGAAFLLLEAQIISRMALLFGTTWIVNSIVIAVLLLLIVAANGWAARFPATPAALGYAGVLATVALCWALPTTALFFRSFWLRATMATLVLCLPVFFAGIAFIKRFAAAGFAADAIGSNLLGALAGGIAESASLWLGLRALLVIAFVFYALAFLTSRRTA